MDPSEGRLIDLARHGELRPQFGGTSLLSLWQHLSADQQELEKTLVGRLFQLSRAIADASSGATPDMRLRDAGSFFYLLEALRRVGHDNVHDLLWMLMDEFANLDERSYDELYLWCIIELSRSEARAVKVLWPQVLELDLRYRSAAWHPPPGTNPVDHPYRLTDLVFYFYAVYTAGGRQRLLGKCLNDLLPELSTPQVELAQRGLESLLLAGSRRVVFGDALGLVKRHLRLPG